MYRLFSLHKSRVYPLKGVSLNRNETIFRLFGRSSCDLCNLSNNSAPKRFQSTHTNPNLKTRKLKKRKTTKKYTDLLMVSNGSTNEYKARITRLNPNDLKFLALTNLNLSELHKLKDMMRSNKFVEEHTYNNLTIIDNPQIYEEKVIIEQTNLEDEIENLENNVLDTKIPSNTFHPEVIEDEIQELEVDEDPVKELTSKKRQDVKLKQEIVSKTLGAYLEICSVLNNPQKGLNAIWGQKSRFKSINILNIGPYNALLHGFASRGNFTKLQEVLKIMQTEKISPNIKTYAIILECLGRIKGNDHLKFVEKYILELKENGFDFDQILNEVNFVLDQRDYVLKAIRMYDKNYEPIYKESDFNYSINLLDHLNNNKEERFEEKKDEEKNLIGVKKMRKNVLEQIEIEKMGYLRVKNIEIVEKPNNEVLKFRESLKKLIKSWEIDALLGFNRDLATLSAKRHYLNLEPYLRSIPNRDFINIIVDEAMLIAQGSETYSPTVRHLHRELGRKVFARYTILRKTKTKVLDKILKIHSDYCEDYCFSHQELGILPTKSVDVNTRKKWQSLEFQTKSEGSSISLDNLPWPPGVLQQIGKFLYNIVMHDLKIDVNVMRDNSKHKNHLPAFYTVFRHQGRIVNEEVKPHPVLSRLHRASMPETLTFPASEVPMRCPPLPWSNLTTGGYLVAPTEFVRLPLTAQAQKERLENSDVRQLYPSFDALNQLAAVPWRVNGKILDLILKVFRKGGSDKLNVPENPVFLQPPSPVTPDMDKSQRFQLFKEKLQYRRKKSEMYSLWCDCLYRLSLANHFRDEIFWLPHNMDFRGRVYPIPPHLNHLGSDLARSMLVFAEARPLGPEGLKWLKLHLVNLTGLKKRDSVEDRLKFAETILDKIFDCADHPLDGSQWWVESDEPWQTLSCAIEITEAIRSGDPENYRSYFPIHQDGSCNGLQHYAALGRDSAGGFSVNLTPAVKPQDVYSAVAVLVEEKRKEDAENGLEIAKVLEGFVRRKVIKQTVMTTVYGVTRYGARLQIARQLKDIDDFPKEHVWAGSSYLTTRTFESLRTMFTSTREIQDWFTECARLISSVCGENVEWTTPLGLPVVQPYFRYKKLTQNAYFEQFHIDKYEKPNVMKQKNAFPPNFIHSLDSTHMMLTSLHCERAGITFVSVHDCYWTHASTVHIMNKICREQFVALHSQTILDDLSEFLAQKYSFSVEDLTLDGSPSDMAKRKLNKTLRKLPKLGDFDIKEVLDSVYFFS
ncbi:DNA-directed RNA polymerase, mitochondrial [Onthophagus taurus]|uniref:DNA-directed RNA polymerase, mitochondrial n=1 Tax=Onthophagus taurus TaxID=166361 RepID=UPI0039BEA545